MNSDFFLWNLDINDAFTTALTSQVITIALVVAGICFTLSLAYNYLTSGFNKLTGDSGDSFPNYSELARGIVIIICINAYLPVIGTIVGTTEAINKATSTDRLENIVAFANLQEANQIRDPDDIDPTKSAEDQSTLVLTPEQIEEARRQNEESDTDIGILKALKNLVALLSPAYLAVTLIHSATAFIIMIIKVIILGIAVVITKILIILGPLAFAFSILPCFKKQLEQWFGTLMTLCMSFTTLNILDAIVDAVTGYIFGNMVSGDLMDTVETAPELIAFDAIIIVVYCSTFWLTSKYVGKSDAGRILSKMVGVATTLASAVIAGGAGAAGAAKGAGIQSAANVANRAMEE